MKSSLVMDPFLSLGFLHCQKWFQFLQFDFPFLCCLLLIPFTWTLLFAVLLILSPVQFVCFPFWNSLLVFVCYPSYFVVAYILISLNVTFFLCFDCSLHLCFVLLIFHRLLFTCDADWLLVMNSICSSCLIRYLFLSHLIACHIWCDFIPAFQFCCSLCKIELPHDFIVFTL